MSATGRVVVTGAAGFVGRQLVRRLVALGHDVVGIVRSSAPTASGKVRYVARDLSTVSHVRDILQPGDTLLHLAARAHMMRDASRDSAALYRTANVAPMRMLCESAAATGTSHLVFVSSAKIYGEGRHAPYTLQDAAAPADPYAQSKLEAEELLRRAAAGGSIEWTVLRPPFVYGPGGKGNFPRLVGLTRVATRVPLPLGSIRNARSVIYVGNLVDAIHRCVVHPAARNRIFLPTDARDPSTPELLDVIATALGRRAHLFPFPVALLRAGAAVLGRGADLDRLTETLRLDGSALRRELEWEAPYSLEEGVRLSLAPEEGTANRA